MRSDQASANGRGLENAKKGTHHHTSKHYHFSEGSDRKIAFPFSILQPGGCRIGSTTSYIARKERDASAIKQQKRSTVPHFQGIASAGSCTCSRIAAKQRKPSGTGKNYLYSRTDADHCYILGPGVPPDTAAAEATNRQRAAPAPGNENCTSLFLFAFLINPLSSIRPRHEQKARNDAALLRV